MVCSTSLCCPVELSREREDVCSIERFSLLAMFLFRGLERELCVAYMIHKMLIHCTLHGSHEHGRFFEHVYIYVACTFLIK